MKAQLGKPTGLALALLSTLLATFLAMGVFTVAQANEHSATRSFSATTVAPGAEITVDIALSEYGEGGSIAETLPEGFSFVSGSIEFVGGGGFARPSGNMVNVVLAGAGVTNVTYKVTAPAAAGGPHAFSGNFVNFAAESVAIGGMSMVTVAAEVEPTPPSENKATEKTEPGSNQSLTVMSNIPTDDGADNIIVKLAGFGVPSSIDTDDVRISLTGGTPGSGFPSDIEIDGTTVTLVAPVVDGDGDTLTAPDSTTGATIIFRRGADITLPTLHGEYDIKVESDEVDDDGVKNLVQVSRQVSVSPKSGTRGTEITITGKGFANGTADIKIGSIDDFTTTEVSDNVFSVKVDTAEKSNNVDVFTGKGERETLINANDAEGNAAASNATFTINPSFSIEPTNPLSGADITIKLIDIDVGTNAVMVSFAGGTAKAATADGSNWKATVPSDARIGTIQMKVTIGDDTLTDNIAIGTNDLSITPTTVVPRQEISIDGGGFTSAPGSDANNPKNVIPASVESNGVTTESNVMVGDARAQNARQLVNNTGNISFNIRVPDDALPGTRTVEVRDAGGRIGVADITVVKPEVTLDPAESLIGSEVIVSGTGFPANDLVLIKYGTNTVATAATNSTGGFQQTITVPSGANIGPGGKTDVEAASQVNTRPVSAKAAHKRPVASITLSPSMASAGQAVSVSGANFKGFLQVYKIEIGGQNVTPAPAPSTDRWGAFTAEDLQVPQLNPGRYAVKVIVADAEGDSATEFLQVALEEVVVLTDPADVFGGLGDRLVRVWFLDRATQQWSFYDPDPEVAAFNTLTEASSGQIVTIIISEGDSVEFQGGTLFAGSNPVSLN